MGLVGNESLVGPLFQPDTFETIAWHLNGDAQIVSHFRVGLPLGRQLDI